MNAEAESLDHKLRDGSITILKMARKENGCLWYMCTYMYINPSNITKPERNLFNKKN